MFADINTITIIGNVTSDVECKYTPSGEPVLNFSIATNHQYKKGEEWIDKVNYHNITAWRNADKLARRIKKGTRVYVIGRIETRSWESKGVKHYRTEILAKEVQLLARYNEGTDKELRGEAVAHVDNTEMVESTL